MKYTKQYLLKLLKKDNNILVESKRTSDVRSAAELLLIAIDNNLIKREDIMTSDNIVERSRGRPKTDYEYLKSIRNNPKNVKVTNVETGEVTVYNSTYKATKETKHGYDYLIQNNGKIIDGLKIEVE